MTTFDLRNLRLRSGDQAREPVEIEIEPLVLGGQTYEPQPNPAPAELAVTRASSGTVLELSLDVALEGPCFRCLQDADLPLQLRLREYEAAPTVAVASVDLGCVRVTERFLRHDPPHDFNRLSACACRLVALPQIELKVAQSSIRAGRRKADATISSYSDRSFHPSFSFQYASGAF